MIFQQPKMPIQFCSFVVSTFFVFSPTSVDFVSDPSVDPGWHRLMCFMNNWTTNLIKIRQQALDVNNNQTDSNVDDVAPPKFVETDEGTYLNRDYYASKPSVELEFIFSKTCFFLFFERTADLFFYFFLEHNRRSRQLGSKYRFSSYVV